mmetsp:Transcript_32964/g.67369  ORF Transcript_32964/g.67369 Transcript_32964/m.67369 type:complete len:228 (-) Transcript_32964:80-763(-)
MNKSASAAYIGDIHNTTTMNMMTFGVRQRQTPQPQWQYQRQSSDESYSSNTSPSKTHRRTSSFIGLMGSGASGSDARSKSTNTAMDPLNMTWSSQGSVALSQVPMMDCYSPSSKSERKFLGGEEDERCLRALELIRELSFCSPPRAHKTKKRTNTAETCETSSYSSDASDHSAPASDPEPEDHHHETSPIGLVDLQQLHDLRRASPSPLVGLQYLPDGYSYIEQRFR